MDKKVLESNKQRGKFLITEFLLITFILILSSLLVSSARLPVVNDDLDNWGTILNDYLRISHTQNGTINTTSFSILGDESPAIKIKRLTGTTGASEGDAISIAHGLSLSNIIGVNVLVTATNGNKITPSFLEVNEFQYGAFILANDVLVVLSATNSGSIVNGEITVLVTYVE